MTIWGSPALSSGMLARVFEQFPDVSQAVKLHCQCCGWRFTGPRRLTSPLYVSYGQDFWQAQRAWILCRSFSRGNDIAAMRNPMSTLSRALVSIIPTVAHIHPDLNTDFFWTGQHKAVLGILTSLVCRAAGSQRFEAMAAFTACVQSCGKEARAGTAEILASNVSPSVFWAMPACTRHGKRWRKLPKGQVASRPSALPWQPSQPR